MGKLTDQQKLDIVQKYKTGKHTVRGLAREYKLDRTSISGILTRRGVKIFNDLSVLNRRNTLNENYFEVIDTEEKAYILGMLFADGCNYQGKQKSIILSLAEQDKETLEKINFLIGSNIKLTFRKKKGENYQNQLRLCVTSNKMSDDLVKLGCVPAKSLILEFPTDNQVPKCLLRHFLRGLIDGDGCICDKKGGKGPRRWCLSIVSSTRFCLKLKEVFKEVFNISSNCYPRRLNKLTSQISISRQEDVYRFCRWLYDEATIFMKRKHDKFLEFERHLKTHDATWSTQFSLK